MAVGTDHFALSDLFFSLRDALGLRNVTTFASSNMVKVQRNSMRVEATIRTPLVDLICIEPTTESCRPSVANQVDSLSVSRLLKTPFSPSASLFRGLVWSWWSRTIATRGRAILGVALCFKDRVAVLASKFATRGVLPLITHVNSMPQMLYPCKDDIFRQTYEEVNL